MGSFYSRLSYSFGNEDWRTEQQALDIQPGNRVLSITASGDRPLNLLSTPLGELTTIDANAMQNALFDLKRAAIKMLDYPNYIAFMGGTPQADRLKTYAQLRPLLSEASQKIWDRQKSKVAKGVIYEGMIEKSLKVVSVFMRPVRGKKIDQLFAFDNLDEQREFLEKSWKTPGWKRTFHVALHPWITRLFLKDPGLYEFVDQEIHVGNYIYDRLHRTLEHTLAKENNFLSLILRGKVDLESFPPYLSEQHFEKIKGQVDQTTFKTIDMHSHLAQTPEASIDRFSCSDIASYMDKANFEKMVEGIFKAAKPGARFCFRQFLSNHHIPNHLKDNFTRDSELEEKLEVQDNCFVYRFMCGTINK